MSRFIEIQKDYKNALNKLEEALTENIEELSENAKQIIIDGTLHRFEILYEITKKLINDCLDNMNIEHNKNNSIQIAFRHKIIESCEEAELWIEILEDINKANNILDEETSKKIYDNIKDKYIIEFKKLEEKFEQIL